MKVQITVDYDGFNAGEVVEVFPAEANQLIAAGVAKRLPAPDVPANNDPPKRNKRDAKE